MSLSDEEVSSSSDGDIGTSEEATELIHDDPKIGQKRKASDGHTESEIEPKSKLTKQNLYKPPTNEELNTLRETENLFHSSLFRLQIDELLTEIALKEKWQTQIKEFMHKLMKKITSMRHGEEHELDKQAWFKKRHVKVPIVQKPMAAKGKFKFIPPLKVQLIGSFAFSACVKPNTHVDLAIVMPKECIQPKDYLNQRYLRKRALYLACISAELKKWDEQNDLMFLYHNNNHMKPLLEIIPSGKLGSHVTVRLHVIPEEGSFKLNRFHICKNNIRKQWFLQENEQHTDNIQDEDDLVPTPHYNTSILIDLTMEQNSSLIKKFIDGAPGVQKGISLLKVWLHQRQLDVGFGSFSGFIVTMFVAFLVSTRKFNKMMSSYQILRNTISYLSLANWNNKGISFYEGIKEGVPTMEEYHEMFPVVFIDSTGYNNICSDMSSGTFERVKHEAKLSMEFIETAEVDSFEMLFMNPVPFMKKFDQIVHLTNLGNLKNACVKIGLEDNILDYCGDYVHGSLNGLHELLQQAIGKRITLLDRRLTEVKKWPIDKTAPNCDTEEKLTFGLLLDTDTCNSVIDKGPTADTLEAGKFRSFWGDKSELRRFQDGGICEAVVWECKSIADKRQVLGKCIKHILDRHCEIPRETITIIGSQMDGLLRLPKRKKKKNIVCGTGEELHLEVLRTYDELCKQIRQLKNLPLSINTIQGVSSVFRYCETFPPVKATFKADVRVADSYSYPVPDKCAPPYTPAISILCLLEGSGKWPEELDAVRRIKAAYILKLAELLEGVHNLVTNPTPTHLYINKNGFVFKLEIGCMREIGLAKITKTPEGLVKTSHTSDSLKLERKYVAVPKLTSTLHGLQQQYGSFCGSVCLAKRWLSSHMMLQDHIPEEAVELIMAYMYISPAPYTVPGSPSAGFVRFLEFLTKWDWKAHPLLVNLNSQFTNEDRTEIQKKFSKERDSLALMFIAIPDDKFSVQWTKTHPSAPILSRLVLLARESLEVLQPQLEDTHIHVDFKQIFRPPLETFDVLIYLNHEHVSRQYQAVDLTSGNHLPDYKEDVKDTILKNTIPVVGYDPVQCYLRELRDVFGDLALFFCDKYGGSVIGVLWKPHSLKQKPFQECHMTAHMLNSNDKVLGLIPNMEAILNDFHCIGDGLVKNIEAKSEILTI